MIRVYVLQQCEIKAGDQKVGRQGKKDNISKILPRQDMTHLQDGIQVDMVFNPCMHCRTWRKLAGNLEQVSLVI